MVCLWPALLLDDVSLFFLQVVSRSLTNIDILPIINIMSVPVDPLSSNVKGYRFFVSSPANTQLRISVNPVSADDEVVSLFSVALIGTH